MEVEVRRFCCVIPSGGGEGSKVDFLPEQIYEAMILPTLGINSLSRLIQYFHTLYFHGT
jgi:hypothetical protein